MTDRERDERDLLILKLRSEGHKWAEIAQATGMSAGVASITYHRITKGRKRASPSSNCAPKSCA
jgi:transposase